MLKEGLQAYLMQRVAPDGVMLDAARLLYLSTLAGAEALGLASEIGSLCSGKAADFVYLRPPAGSALETVLRHAPAPVDALAAIVHARLARKACVKCASEDLLCTNCILS
jgi:guanine deaminase